MKEILLTQGKVALVDDADFGALNAHKWNVDRIGMRFYAARRTPRSNQKLIRMHRVIMNSPDGMDIDHIDGNGLNNQRANLRVCTNAQNARNQGNRKNNTSGFKGVTFNKHAKKFLAQIMLNRRNIFLGYHPTAIEAARAYDSAAIHLHGEFARLNFQNNTILKVAT